jgi:hypothetical protein
LGFILKAVLECDLPQTCLAGGLFAATLFGNGRTPTLFLYPSTFCGLFSKFCPAFLGIIPVGLSIGSGLFAFLSGGELA